MSTCRCSSPCTGSITCGAGCECIAHIQGNECLECECYCAYATSADIASTSKGGKPLDLHYDSTVKVHAHNFPIETMARILAYHAPSLDVYLSNAIIDKTIDYQSEEPEELSELLEKLGFRFAHHLQSST